MIIGRGTVINSGCVLYTGNGIRIGRNVLIAANCTLAPTNHAFADPDQPIRDQGFQPSRGGIVIGDDVWIGANCVLLDGTLHRQRQRDRCGLAGARHAAAILHGHRRRRRSARLARRATRKFTTRGVRPSACRVCRTHHSFTILGAGGFIGTALRSQLESQGHVGACGHARHRCRRCSRSGRRSGMSSTASA